MALINQPRKHSRKHEAKPSSFFRNLVLSWQLDIYEMRSAIYTRLRDVERYVVNFCGFGVLGG
jgi:hypothetical protein